MEMITAEVQKPKAALWRALEGPLVEAGEAAGEGVLEVAAGEVLLEQADQEEAEQPDCSVTENVAAKEQAAVNDEESGFPEGQDKEGKTGDSPGQAGKEARGTCGCRRGRRRSWGVARSST